MRRYSVHEAPRAVLAHELAELIRREEHLNPDRPDRAEAYRRALQEIEMGAAAAMARHTEFRINEDSDSRYGITEGPRAKILAELERYGSDRSQWGVEEKEKKARQIARAKAQLEQPDVTEVRVESIRYRVVED